MTRPNRQNPVFLRTGKFVTRTPGTCLITSMPEQRSLAGNLPPKRIRKSSRFIWPSITAIRQNVGAGQNEGKIRASHLLVKHRDSRRPSSWREAKITRTKEEALEILRGHEARIKSGEVTLGDIAMSESDCSSARKRGDMSVGEPFHTRWITDSLIVDSLAVAKCNSSSKKWRLHSSLVKLAV